MNDTFVVVAGIVAGALSVASERLSAWVASGPPVAEGVTDPAWRFEADRHPAARAWLVESRVDLPPSVARGRLFLGATCDDGERWYGARVGPAAPEVALVVPDPLRGCSARVGAVAVGQGPLPVGPVRVSPAERSGAWVGVTGLAAAAWAVAGVASIDRIRRTAGGPLLGGAVALAILVGVCLPGERLDAVLLSFPGTHPSDLGVDLWVQPTVTGAIQKLGGHGLAFAILGAWGRSSGAPYLRVLARCFAFALATETLQLLIPSRSGRWEDVLLDTVASGTGIAGVAALSRLRRR